MDTLFIENGIEMLRWTDSEGNTWEAEYDAVRFLGKECFEQVLTDLQIELGSSWSVTFKEGEETIEVDNEPTEEVIVTSNKSFYEWCREQETC